ncbi:R-spondin-2-like [Styela clava]
MHRINRKYFSRMLWIHLLILCLNNSTQQEVRSRYGRSVHWRRPMFPMLVARMNRGNGQHVCSRGCSACDIMNGCFRCRSRMFLHFYRSGIRHVGVCIHDCPSGYYGKRGRRMNICKKCEVPNCKTCFTSNYCTACQNKFYLHSAKCERECPSYLIANKWTGSCDEEMNCVVGPWSSWGKCSRRSKSRSCKYGRKRRTRKILQEPTEEGNKCPKLKEGKRCRTPANKCPLINNWILTQMKRIQRKKTKNSGINRKRRKQINFPITTNEAKIIRD